MTNARLLRAGHLARRPGPYYQALVCLGERLRQGSRGSLDLVVMPAGQAGDERAMPDRLAMGELDLAVVTAAGPGSGVPEVYAFDLPYLFPGRWAALAAADRLRSHLDRHFLQAGLTLLAVFDGGERRIFNARRPINHLDDVAGLRLRSTESPVHQAPLRALGAEPVPLVARETLPARERGAIDGGERSPVNLRAGEWYRVAPHYALTAHFVVLAYLVADASRFHALPDAGRDLLDLLTRAGQQVERDGYAAADSAALVELERAGIQFIRPDRAPFAERTQSIWSRVAQAAGRQEWITLVDRAGSSNEVHR